MTEQREPDPRHVDVRIADRVAEQVNRLRMLRSGQDAERGDASPSIAGRHMAACVAHQRIERPALGQDRNDRLERALRETLICGRVHDELARRAAEQLPDGGDSVR